MTRVPFIAIGVAIFACALAAAIFWAAPFTNQQLAQLSTQVLGGGFATFFGAWIAFRFEADERHERELRDRAQAGNRILMDLCVVYNDLLSYEQQILDKLPANLPKWATLRPTNAWFIPSDSMDVGRLEFLLGAGSSNIVGEIAFVRARHETLKDRILVRAAQFERAQEIWATAGTGLAGTTSGRQMADAIGPARFASLADLTDFIVSTVPKDKRKAVEIFRQLRVELKKALPKHHFLDLGVPPVAPAAAAERSA
jgi:hypothetical protein